MGASPDQLERDIVRTREELANTFEAIEDKLKPGRRTWYAVAAVTALALLTWIVRRRR